MTKEQVPNVKIRKEIGKEMTRDLQYVVQWGSVRGKLIHIIWKVEKFIKIYHVRTHEYTKC